MAAERKPEVNVEDEELPDAIPIGSPVREREGRKFYKAFDYGGTEFKPLDPISLNPDEGSPDIPYVALIKEIWEEEGKGELYMTIQWFYRPDEAKKKRGDLYPTRSKNELFYSFHEDEVPAGSVFKHEPIHVIRHTKSAAGIPETEHFVHRVYDHKNKRLRDLEDSEYSNGDSVIIGELLKRSQDALGDLPDASPQELAISALPAPRSASKEAAKKEEPDSKRRKSGRLDGNGVRGKLSDDYEVLDQYEALTGDKIRDNSLAYLYKEVKPAEVDGGSWNGEDTAVLISRLKEVERAAYNAKGEYRALVRHTAFNLKREGTLRRRFFAGELKGSVIVQMDPNELKDGYTAEEKKSNEPVHDDPEPIEMVDKTCTLCQKAQVGVKDIIAGGKGQIYQLECLNCGHSFTARETNIIKVTAGPVDPLKHEKDAPSASMKFSDVEHQMEVQTELLGGYKEARIQPPEAEKFPEEVAGAQGRRAAEIGSSGSAFKESNALKNPAATELGGPQAAGRLEAAELLRGT